MMDWGTCPREAGPPGPRLSSPGEQERNAVMVNRVGVNMLQFCSVSNSLSHATLSIKWEVYFSKELCRSSLLCRRYDSECICIMWLYNSMMIISPPRAHPFSIYVYFTKAFCNAIVGTPMKQKQTKTTPTKKANNFMFTIVQSYT